MPADTACPTERVHFGRTDLLRRSGQRYRASSIMPANRPISSPYERRAATRNNSDRRTLQPERPFAEKWKGAKFRLGGVVVLVVLVVLGRLGRLDPIGPPWTPSHSRHPHGRGLHSRPSSLGPLHPTIKHLASPPPFVIRHSSFPSPSALPSLTLRAHRPSSIQHRPTRLPRFVIRHSSFPCSIRQPPSTIL